MMALPATLEDQARLLEDALVAVRQQTSLMRKCLDTPGKLMDALKCWYVAPSCPRPPLDPQMSWPADHTSVRRFPRVS